MRMIFLVKKNSFSLTTGIAVTTVTAVSLITTVTTVDNVTNITSLTSFGRLVVKAKVLEQTDRHTDGPTNRLKKLLRTA